MAIKLGQGLKRDAGINAPRVEAPLAREPQLPSNSAGQLEAAALESLGNDAVNEVVKRRNAAVKSQALFQNRQDKIQGVRSERAFNLEVTEGLAKIYDTGDIALEETQTKALAFMKGAMDKQNAAFKGSQEGRENNRLRLETRFSAFSDTLSSDGSIKQRADLGKQVDEDIKQQVDIAQQDPASLGEALTNIDLIISEYANTLKPEQEDAFRKDGKRDVYKGAINTQIFQGSLDEASNLLGSREARLALGSDAVFDMQKRIKAKRETGDDPTFGETLAEVNEALPEGMKIEGAEAKEAGRAFLKMPAVARSDFQAFTDSIKGFKKAGFTLKDLGIDNDQLTAKFRSLLGFEETAESLGTKEGIKEASKRKALSLSGEGDPAKSDMHGEDGIIKNEFSASVSAGVVNWFGGSFDHANGKVSGLNEEQSKLVPRLAAKAVAILGDEKSGIVDFNQAVDIVMSGEKNLPQKVTSHSIASDILQSIRTPTDEDVQMSASRFDKINLNNATGPAAIVKNLWSKVGGVISNDWVSSQNAKDVFRLKTLAHEFIIANKRSDRLPVFEQKRLERMFSGPSLTAPGVMLAEFQAMDAELSTDITTKMAQIRDPELPKPMAQAYIEDIAVMGKFQKKLQLFDLKGTKINGGISVNSFTSVEDVNKTPVASVQKFLRTQPDLGSLDDATFEALEKRAKGGGEDAPAGEDALTEGDAPTGEEVKENPEIAEFLTKSSDEELQKALEHFKNDPDKTHLVTAIQKEMNSTERTSKKKVVSE
tara:strand:- start:2931 stop:5231 length:2301 start_codon:yes stop_codon:yes gene_type:complete